MKPAFNPERLIVALDTDNPFQAQIWIDQLASTGCMFKVGNQLVAACISARYHVLDLPLPPGRLMLDLKLWDTKDTVSKTALTLCRALKPRFLTIPLPYNHPSVAETISLLKENSPDTIVLGVTVLTSMDKTAVWEASDCLYHGDDAPARAVAHFAALGKMAGLQGLVCSPHEVPLLKSFNFKYFVTPGIRLPGGEEHDQKRISTPKSALEAGATHLVVGRPITEAPDLLAAAKAILASA
jgi:orotidine-5'-phosphate decarboxylase